MTNTVRTILIVSASAVGTGIISAVSYVKGRRDGIALATKQFEQIPATSGNVRTRQNDAQA